MAQALVFSIHIPNANQMHTLLDSFSLQLLGDRQKWGPTLDIGCIKAFKTNHNNNHATKVKYADGFSDKVGKGVRTKLLPYTNFYIEVYAP